MGSMQDPNADGEALYREFVGAVAVKDWNAVDAMLADDFQSVHSDGARDKAKEMSMLKGEDVGDLTLTDFTSTRAGDTIVATHWLSVEETINGSRLSTKSAPRLTVWRQGAGGWQIIAIASLNPV